MWSETEKDAKSNGKHSRFVREAAIKAGGGEKIRLPLSYI